MKDLIIIGSLPAGWDKSSGVNIEIERARKMGINIFYIDPKDFSIIEKEENNKK